MAPRPNLPRLSRRGFLAAAPTALVIEAGAVPAQPLPELARAWGEARDQVRALMLRWQDLEKDVQRRTGSLNFRSAARGRDAAALEMIAIDKRLPALFEAEAAAAAAVAARPCQTATDALAKLQVGIGMLGPEDTDPVIWALLRDGYGHLARGAGETGGQADD